jgi:hypothetical protein
MLGKLGTSAADGCGGVAKLGQHNRARLSAEERMKKRFMKNPCTKN